MPQPDPEISPDVVRHIAKLARLRISDDQAALYSQQLGRILDHVRSIQGLDLEDVEPLAHPGGHTLELVSDEPTEPLPRKALLDMAPESAPPFIKVPKVLPGADEGGA